MTPQELNASEALFGFVGWLSSRVERTVMSATDDAAGLPDLIIRFMDENNLPDVRDGWDEILKHPKA